MKLSVLIAAGGAPWEAGLVAALDGGAHGVSVARRCVDVIDLLAVASAGMGQAALVAAELRKFDADAVDRLHAAGVVPVGVTPRGDATVEARLHAMGITHVVPSDADAAVVASVLVEAVAALNAEPKRARGFGDPLQSMPIPVPSADAADVVRADPSRPGTVVAVWGPTGAPGRTTVAMALADEIARLGSVSLLVDGDVYGGTVAAGLGLLDESPGLAAACRLAGTMRLEAAALAELCWQVRPGLRVLTGIAIAQRWPEIRASAIEPVLTAARSLADFTVVDCGFGLETDEELSFDSMAPRRNGATLATLDAADVIMVVGAADPIGVQRLVRGLVELREAEVAAPVWVIVNKVRRKVVPGDPDAELTAALQRFAGYVPAALLPYDRDALDTAVANGRLLGEVRPSSALRKAVVDLAAGLLGVPAVTARHRRRA